MKNLYLFLIIVVLFSSCKKDEAVIPQSIAPKELNISELISFIGKDFKTSKDALKEFVTEESANNFIIKGKQTNTEADIRIQFSVGDKKVSQIAFIDFKKRDNSEYQKFKFYQFYTDIEKILGLHSEMVFIQNQDVLYFNNLKELESKMLETSSRYSSLIFWEKSGIEVRLSFVDNHVLVTIEK